MAEPLNIDPRSLGKVAVLMGGLANAGRALQGPDFPAGLVGTLQGLLHDARLHGGRRRVRVHRQHPVHVPAEVEHHTGAHGIAGDRGARAAGGHGHALGPAHLEHGGDLVGVARGGHHQRGHPVERGVRRVQRTGGAITADIGQSGPHQASTQLVGISHA